MGLFVILMEEYLWRILHLFLWTRDVRVPDLTSVGTEVRIYLRPPSSYDWLDISRPPVLHVATVKDQHAATVNHEPSRSCSAPVIGT